MKMTTRIICMAGLALSLASCSNDEQTGTDTAVGNGAAHFTASIGAERNTRAADTAWEADDAIGISGTTGDKTYTNVKYTTKGDGLFTVVDAAQTIYYQTDDEVTFTAYYPWNALAAGATTISADTWEQADQKKFDFLWARAKGKKAAPNVAFTFAHKMAKVVLTIKKGADVSYDEVKGAVLSLGGFKHEGVFDVTTGLAAATGNNSVMWEFANSADNPAWNTPTIVRDDEKQTVSYALLFFPQEFDTALPFSATLKGHQSFSAVLDFSAANEAAGGQKKNRWVAGRQYNLSVTLHKTGITVDGCTIAPWNEAEAGNVDAH